MAEETSPHPGVFDASTRFVVEYLRACGMVHTLSVFYTEKQQLEATKQLEASLSQCPRLAGTTKEPVGKISGGNVTGQKRTRSQTASANQSFMARDSGATVTPPERLSTAATITGPIAVPGGGEATLLSSCNSKASVEGASRGSRGKMPTAHIVRNAEGKFECPFPECGRTFTERTNLRRHLLAHTGTKPYRCSICGLQYYRSDDLNNHVKTHGVVPRSLVSPLPSATHELAVSQLQHPMKSVKNLQSCEWEHSSLYSSEPGQEGQTHTHGVKCGHRPVVLDSAVAFALDDGLLEVPGGDRPFVLPVSFQHPSNCLPANDIPSISPRNDSSANLEHHRHFSGCGHPMVRHGDHIDFLVNGELHHMHGTHCDHHGKLPEIDDDILGFLQGLDGLKDQQHAILPIEE